MSKKIIIVAVVILAIAVLFVACKGKEEQPPQSTEPEITTNVDEKGAYVFNKNNEKVYLIDEDGFNIDPKDAVNMAGSETKEDGFFVGGETDGEKVPNISWDDLK